MTKQGILVLGFINLQISLIHKSSIRIHNDVAPKMKWSPGFDGRCLPSAYMI
jgi:hypothetical protein